jgi:hypothetical protein
MPRPLWNLISVGLPVLVGLAGWILLERTQNYHGRMGILILLIVAMGAVGVLGAVAALVSLFRGESLAWLGVLGLLGNVAALIWVSRFLFS